MILQEVAMAIGAGLGSAVIFFPLTYLAMYKQFKFRGKFGSAWRPFLSSVLALVVLSLLGLSPDTKTISGLMMVFALPITVCALILFFTYREPPEANT